MYILLQSVKVRCWGLQSVYSRTYPIFCYFYIVSL